MFDKLEILFSRVWIFLKKKKCPACNKPFDNYNDWANHFLYIHPPIQTCPECKNNMRYNDFYVNPEEEWMIYKCEECGFLGDSWKVIGFNKKKLNKIVSIPDVPYREAFTNSYLYRKGDLKQSVRVGVVVLSIVLLIVLFSVLGPKPALLIPAIGWSIGIVLFIKKTKKAEKDNELCADDTLKRVDDPDKYT
jgi:hypothetical protein